MALVHVLDGEAFLPTWQRANLAGEAVPWGEMLMEGPVGDPLPQEERARWFETDLGIPQSSYRERRDAVPALLARLGEGDEAVLWFEDDLFCQLNQLFVLARLAKAGPKWSLCERLHGKAVSAATLFEGRKMASAKLLKEADEAWSAYVAPDPSNVENLLSNGTLKNWPNLDGALRLHLERFPDLRNGLDPLEAAALRGLEEGELPFTILFRAITSHPPVSAWGVGDLQVARAVRALAAGPRPLVRIHGKRYDAPKEWRVEPTPDAKRVLAGTLDRAECVPLLRWIGGVRFTGGAGGWRWDAAARHLVKIRPW